MWVFVQNGATFEKIYALFEKIYATFEKIYALFEKIDALFEKIDALFERPVASCSNSQSGFVKKTKQRATVGCSPLLKVTGILLQGEDEFHFVVVNLSFQCQLAALGALGEGHRGLTRQHGEAH